MTTFYISSSTGSDSTGNGTIGNPYRTWTKIISLNTITAGDSAFCKRGDIFSEQLLITSLQNGTAISPITVDAYGPVSENKPVFTTGTGNGVVEAGAAGGGGWNIRNLEIRTNGQNAVNLQNSSTAPSIFEFLDIYGGSSGGVGFYVQPDGTLKNVPQNYQFRYNTINNMQSCALQYVGRGANWRFSNNFVNNCSIGFPQNALEIYTYPQGTGIGNTLTFALVGGNIYSAAVPNYNSVTVDYISGILIHFSGDSFNYNLRDAGSTTTPAAFEYGYVPGTQTLYVNLNGLNASTNDFHGYSIGLMRGVVVENNIITNTKRNSGSDGNAICLDSYSGWITIRGNYFGNNAAAAVLIQGGYSRVYGNIMENNAVNPVDSNGSIIAINAGRDSIINNNTVIQASAAGGVAPLACVWLRSSMEPQNNNMSNNIITGGQFSYLLDGGASTSYVGSNNVCFNYGNAQAYTAHTASGTLNVNPQLDSSYRPQNSSVRGAGAFAGGQDYHNNDFPAVPDIGAVQYSAARAASINRTIDIARTIVSSRTISTIRGMSV